MNRPGDAVLALLRAAAETSLIVAPFMRSHALERVLHAVPEGVEVVIVTRWRPSDIISGASDLGVFDIVTARDVTLYLRHDLHAKMFAADRTCLIGSANVTDTALGWREPANLELLTLADRDSIEIRAFEDELFRGAVQATSELRDLLQGLVDELSAALPPLLEAEFATEEMEGGLMPPSWFPRSKNPEDLFAVYQDKTDAVSRASLPGMQEELRHLGVAPGLAEPQFNSWVRVAMSQSSVIADILTSTDESGGINEAEFASLLEASGMTVGDSELAADLVAIQRWLSHFMPGDYETRQDTIRLIKAKTI